MARVCCDPALAADPAEPHHFLSAQKKALPCSAYRRSAGRERPALTDLVNKLPQQRLEIIQSTLLPSQVPL